MRNHFRGQSVSRAKVLRAPRPLMAGSFLHYLMMYELVSRSQEWYLSKLMVMSQIFHGSTRSTQTPAPGLISFARYVVSVLVSMKGARVAQDRGRRLLRRRPPTGTKASSSWESPGQGAVCYAGAKVGHHDGRS